MPVPFRPVDKTIAYDSVREQILEMIKSGELKLGDRLPAEIELARAFGVSRPVVREALGSLRALGLVQSETGRGTYVSSARPPLILGNYSVRELHEVRCFLEIPTARLAAERCRAGGFPEHLRTVFAKLGRCDDRHEWVELDGEFHLGLAELTGNRVLVELTAHILGSVKELSYSLTLRGRLEGATHEHLRVFETVLAGEGPAAEEAMRAHLLATYEAAIALFDEDELSLAGDPGQPKYAPPGAGGALAHSEGEAAG
jgi:GntR family transcriptional repressor for pyruvate dehydrogenase complex